MSETNNDNRASIDRVAMPRMFANSDCDVEPTDDTDGSPVGWTIVAIGRDGSILCQAPNGRRCRWEIECHFDGMQKA